MCLIDYQLSRFVRTVYHREGIAAGQHITIPASKQRISIEFFSLDLPGVLFLAIDNIASAFDIVLADAPSIPLKWTFAVDGDTPQRSFSILNNSMGPTAFVWVERLIPESVLNKYVPPGEF